jgi:hypothetical protein
MIQLVNRRRKELVGGPGFFPALAAVLLGTLLGWALRPNPVAAAELAYVQIVRLFAVKATDQPLIFATELAPLPLAELGRTSWLFLVAWAGAVVVSLGAFRRAQGDEGPWHTEPRRVLLATSVLISLTFLALTVVSARRALVEFVAFGFLAIPVAWTMLGPETRRRAALALGMLLVVHVPWGARRHMLNAVYIAQPPDAMADVATWLARNSEPGDVVFHTHWDSFGPLFARNRTNRYLGGMDPIFQYAHDPGAYWEHFYLSGNHIAEYTCDAFPCYEGTATETHAAIRDNFGAEWLLLEPHRDPKLTEYVMNHPGFELRLQTRRERVFRVLPTDAPALSADPAR